MSDLHPPTELSIQQDYEALTQFVYTAPIGLAQTRVDGSVLLMNPVCAQLLLPLAPTGDMENLLAVLDPIAPDLRARIAAFASPHGVICERMQLHTGADESERRPQVLALTLIKLDAMRLMAVLVDITESLRRDHDLRQTRAWVNAIATSLKGYMLTTLDAKGRIGHWNPSVERVVGWSAAHVRTSGLQDLLADVEPEHAVAARLGAADRTGWSRDEGWMLRADGSRFLASSMIAPLELPEGAGDDARSYSLIVRELAPADVATVLGGDAMDHSTGVHSRSALFELAPSAIAHCRGAGKPLSLMSVRAGETSRSDEGMRAIATALRDALRTSDTLARTGVDTFVALLPGTPEEYGTELTTRVRRAIATACGAPSAAAASIGFATLGADTCTIAALIARAVRQSYAG